MNIGVIGTGLIGSSLCRAFIEAELRQIHIYDSNPEHLRIAGELGLGTPCQSGGEVAQNSDVIFVCVPVCAIAAVAKEAADAARRGTIITDVGSVKGPIAAALTGLPEGVAFVPGHPIAGTERSGPRAGQADLFRGRRYVITPTAEAPRWAIEKIADLVAKIGAQVAFLEAETHDRVFAFTSHLPHICAFAASRCQEHIERGVGPVGGFAGGSMRDLTRVAASDPTMWRDIFLANADHVRATLRLFQAELTHLGSLIDTSAGGEALFDYLEQARALRNKLFPRTEEA